jgi:tetratricopeptide (TPR) repeat protein
MKTPPNPAPGLALALWLATAALAQPGPTPLLKALQAGDTTQARQLLARGADPNTPDANGATPLMWAAYRGSLNLVRELVAAKADPRRKGAIYLDTARQSYYGNLPGIAAGEGNLPLLRYLLDGLGLPVDDREYNPETGKEDGWTAAQWADSRADYQKGDHGQVMAYLERRQADLAFLRDTARDAGSDLVKGRAYYKHQAYLATAHTLEKQLPRYERQWGAQDTTVYVKLLARVGRARYERGEYADALPHYQKAADIWRQAGGETHPSYATSLHNLAALYQSQDRYAEAEPLYQRVIEIFKTALGETHPGYATSLNNLAALYESLGLYARAEPLYRQSLEITKTALGETHPSYSASLHNLAALYESLGLYARAEPLHRRALEISRTALGENHPQYATSLNNLANLYESQGLYAQAKPLFQQALEIRKTALGENHPQYATSLNNLANLYESQGLYAQAEPLFQQALEIRQTALGENHPGYAASLNNLAALYKSQGLYAQAGPLYRQALEIRKTALGENHPDYANSLNDLALLYQSQGLYAKAGPLYRQALEIRKTALGENHPDYAASLNNLAELYLSQGLYAKAGPLFQQALEIRKTALGENHPDYATSLNNLALLYYDRGLYAEAEPLFRAAVANKLAQVRGLLPTLAREAQADYLASIQGFFDNFAAFALARRAARPAVAAELYDLALATKALRLNLAARVAARANADPALARLRDRWLAASAGYQKAAQLTLQQRADAGVDLEKMRQGAEALEREVFAKTGLENRAVTWQDVRARLRPGQVAVELLRVRVPSPRDSTRLDTVYAALALAPETRDHPRLFTLPGGAALEGRYLAAYQAAIQGRGLLRAPVDPALPTEGRAVPPDSLYGLYWRPLLDSLRGLSPGFRQAWGAGQNPTVYLAPDGAFHLLNLEALLDPATKRYLAERADLVRVASTRSVAVPPSAPAGALAGPPGPPLLLGRPAYGLDTARLAQEAGKAQREGPPGGGLAGCEGDGFAQTAWGDLPGTQAEADTLARLMAAKGWAPENRTGPAAVEEAVKRPGRRPRVLHLATHGFFLGAAACAPPGGPGDGRGRAAALLRSGVVLAGAATFAKAAQKPPTDDGLLLAVEAQDLDLAATGLVVLSACQTAVGDPAGAGGPAAGLPGRRGRGGGLQPLVGGRPGGLRAHAGVLPPVARRQAPHQAGRLPGRPAGPAR